MHAYDRIPLAAPDPEVRLNDGLEVISLGEDRVELRLPLWGVRIEASTYQLGLLNELHEWRRLPELLRRYPFDRPSTEVFLDRCTRASILFVRGEDGHAQLPREVQVAQTMFATPAAHPSRPAAFTFIGVPWDGATTAHPGARFGPSAIRAASAETRYTLDPVTLIPRGFFDQSTGEAALEGVGLADAGDVLVPPGDRPEMVYRRISESVSSILEVGSIPLVLGGDHSITHPILKAFPKEPFGIIHLDAHTDLATPIPQVGLNHGNAFTCILRDLPHVESLTQIGVRGRTEGARDDGQDADPRVRTIGMAQLRKRGLEACLSKLSRDLPYYVSIDIDVVDPLFAPSTGTPVFGGMHPQELVDVLTAIGRSFDLIGADVCEVSHPSLRTDQTGAIAVDGLLALAEGYVNRVKDQIEAHHQGDNND